MSSPALIIKDSTSDHQEDRPVEVNQQSFSVSRCNISLGASRCKPTYTAHLCDGRLLVINLLSPLRYCKTGLLKTTLSSRLWSRRRHHHGTTSRSLRWPTSPASSLPTRDVYARTWMEATASRQTSANAPLLLYMSTTLTTKSDTAIIIAKGFSAPLSYRPYRSIWWPCRPLSRLPRAGI